MSLEEKLLEKIKDTMKNASRESIGSFAEQLLERVWSMPDQRELLLDAMDIIEISLDIKKVKKGRPKKERKPRKVKDPETHAKAVKGVKKQQEQSAEEIADDIAQDIEDMPEETMITSDEIEETQETLSDDDIKDDMI